MTTPQPRKTVSEILKTAIDFEEAAAETYADFARIFASQPDLAQLWESMRKDELMHAKLLKVVDDKLTPEHRQELAPQKICESLDYLQNLFASIRLKKIETFDDAYDVAHQLEFSEINAIFKFMATELVPDSQHPLFLDNQVDEHLYKLLDYKHKYLQQKKAK